MSFIRYIDGGQYYFFLVQPKYVINKRKGGGKCNFRFIKPTQVLDSEMKTTLNYAQENIFQLYSDSFIEIGFGIIHDSRQTDTIIVYSFIHNLLLLYCKHYTIVNNQILYLEYILLYFQKGITPLIHMEFHNVGFSILTVRILLLFFFLINFVRNCTVKFFFFIMIFTTLRDVSPSVSVLYWKKYISLVIHSISNQIF